MAVSPRISTPSRMVQRSVSLLPLSPGSSFIIWGYSSQISTGTRMAMPNWVIRPLCSWVDSIRAMGSMISRITAAVMVRAAAFRQPPLRLTVSSPDITIPPLTA